MSQIEVYRSEQDLTPEQYIDLTEKRRYTYCDKLLSSVIKKFPLDHSKRNTTIVKIPTISLKKKFETSYMEGEIKMLETFVNLMIEHQHDDINVLFGSLELAISKKLVASNEKYAIKGETTNINVVISDLINACEKAKENYKSK